MIDVCTRWLVKASLFCMSSLRLCCWRHRRARCDVWTAWRKVVKEPCLSVSYSMPADYLCLGPCSRLSIHRGCMARHTAGDMNVETDRPRCWGHASSLRIMSWNSGVWSQLPNTCIDGLNSRCRSESTAGDSSVMVGLPNGVDSARLYSSRPHGIVMGWKAMSLRACR